MDPKRWSAQLPQPVSSEAFPRESLMTQAMSSANVVNDWPIASDSTVGLDEASNVFKNDLDELKSLDLILGRGMEWVYRLYALRSISRAIPLGDEQQDAINRGTFSVLLPLVRELSELISFVDSAVKKICDSVSFLLKPERRKRTLPKAVLSRMVALVDVIVTLDNLKDMKTQILNDFTAFKRSLSAIQKTATEAKEKTEFAALDNDVKKVQTFLVAKSNISSQLRVSLHTTPGDHGEVIQDLFSFALTELEMNRFVHPEEKFRLIRFLPYAFYLIDHVGTEPTMKPCNAFKLKRLTEKNVKQVFRRFPVVPLFEDMHVTLIVVLERCLNFKMMTDADPNILLEWGGSLPVSSSVNPGSNERSKAEQVNLDKSKEDRRNYELTNHWRTIRIEFDDFASRFQACARRVRTDALDQVSQEKRAFDAQAAASVAPLQPDAPPENPEAQKRRKRTEALDKEAYDLTLEGLRLLGRWKELVWQQMGFKYSKGAEPPPGQTAASVYDLVVRYNHSPVELAVLFDVVCTIKSLGAMMGDSASLFSMPIRRRIHLEMQEFAQLRLLRLCHAVYKKKKQTVLALVTQLRMICLDWFTLLSPTTDFKEKKVPRKLKEYEKNNGLAIGEDDDAPLPTLASTSVTKEENDRYIAGSTRAVGPSPTQLTLIRSFIEAVRDPDKNEGMLEGFLEGFSSLIIAADLDRAQADQLKEFFNRSFFFPYMMSLQTSLASLGDLSFLWHREFYLEMSKQVQFPIKSSLPWICLEEMLMGPSANATSMIDSVLFFLDIYNDAAMFSLKTLRQQYLFDEVEAEAKLVFEQFIFLLGDTIYTHYKNVNSGRLLDKSYRARLQELRKGKAQAKSFLSLVGTAGAAVVGAAASSVVNSSSHSSSRNLSSAPKQKYLETEHRRYSNLLSERSFHFLGRTIDIPKWIANQLNEYVQADLEVVFSRFEDMGLTSSKELESLLLCMERTHDDLSRTEQLGLDGFEIILEVVDERISSGIHPKTRLARYAEKELIYEIIGRFCYSSITERFVPSSEASTKKAKTQGLPNFLYGKNFKDAFVKANQLELEFFSLGHLEALIRSGSIGLSSPHAFGTLMIASLTEAIVDRTKIVIRELEEMFRMYSGKITSSSAVKPPSQLFSGSQALSAFDTIVKQVVTIDENRKKTLQLLREFGNALIVMKLLHACLDRMETRAFVQTSTLTGLDTFVPSGADQVAPPSVEATVGMTKFLSERNFSKEQEELLRDEMTVSVDLYRSPGLLRNAYRVMIDTVREVMLPGDVEQRKEVLVKVANCLEFSFASTSGGIVTAVPVQEDDETRYGDGVVWGLEFIMFSLGSLAKFESVDFCSHVARADSLERCWKSDESSMKEPAASSNLNAFLKCVRETIEPAKALVSSFLPVLFYEAEFETGNSHPNAGKVKKIVTLFHPPGASFDEATGEIRPQKLEPSGSARRLSATSGPSEQRAAVAPPPPARTTSGVFSSSTAPPPPPRTALDVTSHIGAPPPPPRTTSDVFGAPPPPPRTVSERMGAPPPPPRITTPGEAIPALPPRDHNPFGSAGEEAPPPRLRRSIVGDVPQLGGHTSGQPPARPPRTRNPGE